MEERKTAAYRIIITGPESTGKTELCHSLSKRFDGVLIPEYARSYVESLTNSYTYQDLEKIATHQVKEFKKFSKKYSSVIFADTYLIITKIWFKWVFGEYPLWIDEELMLTKQDLYLLCNTDISWVPDKVRENGGERREKLFKEYRLELDKLGAHYVIVEGIGEKRVENAATMVKKFIADQEKSQYAG